MTINIHFEIANQWAAETSRRKIILHPAWTDFQEVTAVTGGLLFGKLKIFLPAVVYCWRDLRAESSFHRQSSRM